MTRYAYAPSGQNTNPYKTGGANEHSVMVEVAEWAVKETIAHDYSARSFSVLDGSNLQGIYEQAKQVNAWGADYSVSLHSNASAGYSLGVLGIVYSQERIAWATKLCATLCGYTKLPFKGIRIVPGVNYESAIAGAAASDEGLAAIVEQLGAETVAKLIILKQTTSPTLLIELNAHDTTEGSNWNLNNRELLGRSLGKATIVASGGKLVWNPDPVKPPTSDWTPEALRLKELGILTGKDDGSFDPNGMMTRRQVAIVLCRVIDKFGLTKV